MPGFQKTSPGLGLGVRGRAGLGLGVGLGPRAAPGGAAPRGAAGPAAAAGTAAGAAALVRVGVLFHTDVGLVEGVLELAVVQLPDRVPHVVLACVVHNPAHPAALPEHLQVQG